MHFGGTLFSPVQAGVGGAVSSIQTEAGFRGGGAIAPSPLFRQGRAIACPKVLGRQASGEAGIGPAGAVGPWDPLEKQGLLSTEAHRSPKD